MRQLFICDKSTYVLDKLKHMCRIYCMNKNASIFLCLFYFKYILCTVCHFPIGILGQVWYLIISIPDLSTLTYFYILRIKCFTKSQNMQRCQCTKIIITANKYIIKSCTLNITYTFSLYPK